MKEKQENSKLIETYRGAKKLNLYVNQLDIFIHQYKADSANINPVIKYKLCWLSARQFY
jgi:hypothetical protein